MFDLTEYLGTWYEILHSPTWFETTDNYNTMAEYSLDQGSTISVKNSTMRLGKVYESIGTGKYLGDGKFIIDFSEIEKVKTRILTNNMPNYVIDKIWYSGNQYITAIITNTNRSYLSVLTRNPRISLNHYNQIINYISETFRDVNIIQVPHYC
jgi:lipocalin